MSYFQHSQGRKWLPGRAGHIMIEACVRLKAGDSIEQIARDHDVEPGDLRWRIQRIRPEFRQVIEETLRSFRHDLLVKVHSQFATMIESMQAKFDCGEFDKMTLRQQGEFFRTYSQAVRQLAGYSINEERAQAEAQQPSAPPPGAAVIINMPSEKEWAEQTADDQRRVAEQRQQHLLKQ